jgi:hypothetical protein
LPLAGIDLDDEPMRVPRPGVALHSLLPSARRAAHRHSRRRQWTAPSCHRKSIDGWPTIVNGRTPILR